MRHINHVLQEGVHITIGILILIININDGIDGKKKVFEVLVNPDNKSCSAHKIIVGEVPLNHLILFVELNLISTCGDRERS